MKPRAPESGSDGESEMSSSIKIITGNANPRLARDICDYLDLEPCRCEVRTFSDGETYAEIGENVRGMDVFVVQPTSAPANSNLMELLILIHTARLSSARRVTAVVPYFGYARQDRKLKPRTPISAKLVSDLVSTAGADRVLCVDLHAGQIQGFFNIPVDNLFAMPALLEALRELLGPTERIAVVAPDPGGVERARAFAKRLGGELVIADKRRPEPNVAEILHIVGDVRGRVGLIVDDMIDTAGTLTLAAKAVMEAGATRVLAVATHPVLSGPAVKRIQESALENVVVSDTIPLRLEAQECGKIRATSIARLLGEAIRRTHNEESVSSLFV
jgi:ribose-phosphate pyrophosphokinase